MKHNNMRDRSRDSLAPQASASTNSATRAQLSVADDVSQEKSAASRAAAPAEKIPKVDISARFRTAAAGKQNETCPGLSTEDSLRLRSRMRRFWRRMRVQENGCWLWAGGTSANGYGSTTWFGASWTTHRLAWHLANRRMADPLAPDVQIRHTCDVRRCCNPEHLATGTAADNAQDAVERGRTNGGKPLGLTHREVRHRIFELAALGTPKVQIARELGMSERNVHYHLSKRKP